MAELKLVAGGDDAPKHGERKQYSTFSVAGHLYGIDVTRVQEVVKPMAMTSIPLAPVYVRGLINLRGQVATAVGMKELLGVPSHGQQELMNVVCKCDGNLVSLLVDDIGDVIEVSQSQFEKSPATIPDSVRKFMTGVYKITGSLLSIIDIDLVAKYLNKSNS